MWNKYRGRIRYIWNPKWALWLPNQSYYAMKSDSRFEYDEIANGEGFVCKIRRRWFPNRKAG